MAQLGALQETKSMGLLFDPEQPFVKREGRAEACFDVLLFAENPKPTLSGGASAHAELESTEE